MTLIAHIDARACAAHGDCLELAPSAFAMEDTAVVTGTAPPEQLMAAAEACPAVAIAIVDSETGEQLFP
jgi:ferredoxin